MASNNTSLCTNLCICNFDVVASNINNICSMCKMRRDNNIELSKCFICASYKEWDDGYSSDDYGDSFDNEFDRVFFDCPEILSWSGPNNIKQILAKLPKPDIINKDLSRVKIFNYIDEFSDYFNVAGYQQYCTWALVCDRFRSIFGFSIPSAHALDQIVEFIGSAKTLEVGAGLGIWSHLLQLSGVDITPTSICDKIYYGKKSMEKTWTEIELINCTDAVIKYNPECLFLSWGCKTLARSMKHFTGSKIVIIGEEKKGVTDCLYSCEEFEGVKVFTFKIHNQCSQVYKYRLVNKVTLPHWLGIHDSVYFYEKFN